MSTELEQKVNQEGWSLYEILHFLGRGHPSDVSVEMIQRSFLFPTNLAQEVYDYWSKGREG